MLFGIVLLTSLAMVMWTYWNKKSRVIRASQPFFLYFICVGKHLLPALEFPANLFYGRSDADGGFNHSIKS
jgi:hypothetical protein